MLRYSFTAIILILISNPINAQTNLVQAFFQSEIRNESYKIYFASTAAKKKYGSTLVKKFRVSKEAVIIPIEIPLDSGKNYKNGSYFPIHILRRGLLGLCYKNTYTEVAYDATKKYLILYRDPKMKKKYALRWFWSNDKPSNI